MSYSLFSTKSQEEILRTLNTRLTGLNLKEITLRQQKYGKNEVLNKETTWKHILIRQFQSPFLYILFFAAALALSLGETIEGGFIAVFVLINASLGFIQEYNSLKALQLLKSFIKKQTRVLRDGRPVLIAVNELVPGDIVVLEAGDMIPADIRFLNTQNLLIDESILTGESEPVVKIMTPLETPPQASHQAKNIGFSATTVVSGKAIGVVIAIGQDSILGQVAVLTSKAKRISTFEKGISSFSKFILKMILIILFFIFIANIAIKGHQSNITELLIFSIALAVSVIPEALPVVTTISLSRGAVKLAENKVVVKRLSAVEDLGSIEILCTDKTGTLTENNLTVANIKAQDQEQCLFYACLAASSFKEKKAASQNPFDLALFNKLTASQKKLCESHQYLSEIPFDPVRRLNSVLIHKNSNYLLVVRGALEAILDRCDKLSSLQKQEIFSWAGQESTQGKRIFAIAFKNFKKATRYLPQDESQLTFVGAISFLDPIKSSAKNALTQAKKLGINIKILTGDSKEVAGAVAFQVGLISDPENVLLGEELEKMSSEKQMDTVIRQTVFARVSPQQKYKIIELLQQKYEVGFLGEGINDAPALKLANVGLVVEGASDIAREAADIILLNKSLNIIISGIKTGREIFANTVKYLKITLISNFGNFYAVAVASLLITYLPMLPTQILLLNLLSDFPMIAIATDNVDATELRRPKTYNIKEIVLISIIFGLLSTIFDFILFSLFYRQNASILQTNWFIGSVLTELILIYSIRTKIFCLRAKPTSLLLTGLSLMAAGITIIIPFTSFGQKIFQFHAPSLKHILLILNVVILYFIVTEIAKLVYYRTTNGTNSSPLKEPDRMLP